MARDPQSTNLPSWLSMPPWLIDSLRDSLPSGRGQGHAYVVVSEDAEEAALFSLQLAIQKLCHDTEQAAACLMCQSCSAFLQNTHGDLLVIERAEGKTAIGIDQIRQATHFLQQTSLYGDLKMLLIRDANHMTLAAANSLLKTLEEPSGNTLILLSTAETWRLPATVRSRCQMIRLPSPDKASAERWLAAEIQGGADEARRMLTITQGRTVTALGMADSDALAEQYEVANSLEGLSNNQSGPPASWSRVELEQLLLRLQIWIEESVRRLEPDRFAREAQSWLLLHRCVCELSSRVKQGATPSREIVVAELFRLCRSRGHAVFPSVIGRFFASVGTQGLAG